MPKSQSVGSILLVVVLVTLLVLSIAVGAVMWTDLGPVEMSAHGITAMTFGIVASLGVGIGLMLLVFYSSRRGYDDRAG